MCGKSNLSFFHSFLSLLSLSSHNSAKAFFPRGQLLFAICCRCLRNDFRSFKLPFLCYFPLWSDSDVKIFVFISTAFPVFYSSFFVFHVTNKGFHSTQNSEKAMQRSLMWFAFYCLCILFHRLYRSFRCPRGIFSNCRHKKIWTINF